MGFNLWFSRWLASLLRLITVSGGRQRRRGRGRIFPRRRRGGWTVANRRSSRDVTLSIQSSAFIGFLIMTLAVLLIPLGVFGTSSGRKRLGGEKLLRPRTKGTRHTSSQKKKAALTPPQKKKPVTNTASSAVKIGIRTDEKATNKKRNSLRSCFHILPR